MAGMAEALNVVVVVRATVGEGKDMVGHDRLRDLAKC